MKNDDLRELVCCLICRCPDPVGSYNTLTTCLDGGVNLPIFYIQHTNLDTACSAAKSGNRSTYQFGCPLSRHGLPKVLEGLKWKASPGTFSANRR